MLASLKQQYVELLSDIGFTQAGLRLRNVQRAARENGTDGIVEATGSEVRETLSAAERNDNQLSSSQTSLKCLSGKMFKTRRHQS